MIKKKVLPNLPEQVIADYQYKEGYVPKGSTVRFLLKQTPELNKSYVLFAIAQKVISPMQYAKESFQLIQELLNTYSIKLDDVAIYLDYEERHSQVPRPLIEWKFDHKNGEFLADHLNDMTVEELSEPLREIRSNYYNQFDTITKLKNELRAYTQNDITLDTIIEIIQKVEKEHAKA